MKYLFYIAKTYSIPIIKPLVSVLERKGALYCFYVSDKVKQRLPQEWDRNLVYSSLRDAINFEADFVLCPGNFVDFRIPGIKVQLFHGLGVEKASHYKIRHFFDVYLTSGPFVTKRFNRLQKKYGYFLVIETGWSKVDYILNYPSKNLKEKLGIPDNKKIILYAPTFSAKMESASELKEVIPNIIREDEFWLFKFHELMDKAVVNQFRAIDGKQGKILDTEDITPYLHVADVMLSDTSSVIYEFMLLDKPVVTYKTQSRKDKGINIWRPSDLRQALDQCLSNPLNHQKQRKRHISEINPYVDGKISENIISELEAIIKEDKLPKKRKPLNLFRKMQIVYHSIFRRGYLK